MSGGVVRNQPTISTFCGVDTVFIGKPDETIFYDIIELHMHVVNGIRHYVGKRSVENLSMRVVVGYHIFDR